MAQQISPSSPRITVVRKLVLLALICASVVSPVGGANLRRSGDGLQVRLVDLLHDWREAVGLSVDSAASPEEGDEAAKESEEPNKSGAKKALDNAEGSAEKAVDVKKKVTDREAAAKKAAGESKKAGAAAKIKADKAKQKAAAEAKKRADKAGKEAKELEESLENMGTSNTPPPTWKNMGLSTNKKDDLDSFFYAISTHCFVTLLCILIFSYFRGNLRMVYAKNAWDNWGFSPPEERAQLQNGVWTENPEAEEAWPRESDCGHTLPRRPGNGMFDWVKASMSVRTSEVLACAGLDQAMLMQFTLMGMWTFASIGLPMCLIVAPIHVFLGGGAAKDDYLSWQGFGNVVPGNSLICWMHAAIVWIVVLAVDTNIYHCQEQFVRLRVEWLHTGPALDGSTIMVEGIPTRQLTRRLVRDFFAHAFAGNDKVEEVHVVVHTERLTSLMAVRDAAKQYAETVRSKQREMENDEVYVDGWGRTITDLMEDYRAKDEEVKKERQELHDRMAALDEEYHPSDTESSVATSEDEADADLLSRQGSRNPSKDSLATDQEQPRSARQNSRHGSPRRAPREKSGALLGDGCLLGGPSPRETPEPASISLTDVEGVAHAVAPQEDVKCRCGNTFMRDASFCRKCGATRPPQEDDNDHADASRSPKKKKKTNLGLGADQGGSTLSPVGAQSAAAAHSDEVQVNQQLTVPLEQFQSDEEANVNKLATAPAVMTPRPEDGEESDKEPQGSAREEKTGRRASMLATAAAKRHFGSVGAAAIANLGLDKALEKHLDGPCKHQEEIAKLYCNTAFVTFQSRFDAVMAARLQPYTPDKQEWIVSLPPDPADVLYSDFMRSKNNEKALELLGFVLIGILFMIFLPTIAFISSQSNLNAIGMWWPAARQFALDFPKVKNMWNGIAGALGLNLALSFLPTILMLISTTCFKMKSSVWAQLHLQKWYFIFLIVFQLLVVSITQSMLATLGRTVHDPLSLVRTFSAGMCRTTHFFLSIFVLQWSTIGMELTRYVAVFKFLAFMKIKDTPEEAAECAEPEDQDYYGIGARSARYTSLFVAGICFITICPIMSIVAFIHFFLVRVLIGYCVVYAETKKPDLGGEFWVATLKQCQAGLCIFIVGMSGILCERSSTVIPGVAAGLSLVYMIESMVVFNDRFHWKTMSHEEVMETHRRERAGEGQHRQATRDTYMQPELCASSDKHHHNH